MKNIPLIATLVLSATLNAQYYYNDIIGTKELNSKMKAFLAAKVQSVTATGYDPQGRKATDFNEWQDVQANGTILKITTRNGQSVARTYYQFDDKTRVITARDSSSDIQSVTTYTYDPGDNIIKIKTVTSDNKNDFNESKERQWAYTADGKPDKMLLIQNGTDSQEYKFSLDEKKNVQDEMLYHRGGSQNQIYYTYEQQKVYYFYDDTGRLTDITKYNTRLDRLLPDFMFEYDDNNHVIQKITVLSTVQYDTKLPDYLIWRYAYNDKNLKTREAMYSKARNMQGDRVLKGRIEYAYTFSQ